mgnify:CR=1 FL=1
MYIGLLEKELAVARVQMAQLVLNESGGKTEKRIDEAALLRNLKQATATANAATREAGYFDSTYGRGLPAPRRRPISEATVSMPHSTLVCPVPPCTAWEPLLFSFQAVSRPAVDSQIPRPIASTSTLQVPGVGPSPPLDTSLGDRKESSAARDNSSAASQPGAPGAQQLDAPATSSAVRP